MTIEHSAIADGERHEPKGADGASAGMVYVSDGANSGTWKARSELVSILFDTISTADTIYIAMPFAGAVTDMVSVLYGTISGTDAVITATINGTAITGASITVATAGSAAGDVDTSTTITATNTFTAGQYVSISTDGASTGNAKCEVTLLISRYT